MEKNYKQSNLNKYSIPYNIDTINTPLKPNKLKNKEIILNSFLQETYNQKKSKAKANLLYEKMIEEQNPNKLYLKNDKKKINFNNNRERILTKNDLPLTSYYQKKHKNKIDNQDSNAQNYQVLNNFLDRNTSNKSSVFPSNENQISILINTRKLEPKNENSFFKNSDDKKNRRHKTVYIKKNLSVERCIKTSKNNYKNISQDDKYFHSNKKIEQKYITTSTTRKKEKNIAKENNTNNINSNVNIFNFGMQYSNAPHYFIRNSKMFNPYFNNFYAYNNPKINFNVNHDNIIEESAIMIQSAYRGCVIRFQINSLLKTYKGIEFLDSFFKNKLWKIFKKKVLLFKIHFEYDCKLSISSISSFSALANSNYNKIINISSYNQKILQESKEAFFILNKNNNENDSCEEKYISSFENINYINNDEKTKNKKLIWNKKMANKNNSIISNIINQKLFSKNIKKIKVEKQDNSFAKEKEKYLKILVTKKMDKSRLTLLKYFLRFYYNGILYNDEKIKKNKCEEINNNATFIKLEKLKKIIEKKNAYHFEKLFKYFCRFKFKVILNYIQNHQYLIINGGRLKNIEQDSFFIYEFTKNKKIVNNNELFRNLKIILEKIIKLRKIIYDKKKTKIELIKKNFHKFRMAGIRYYMQKELKKKLLIKIIILKATKDNCISKIEDKSEAESHKYKKLNKLILKYNNYNLNCCKNIFDRWNLRTKIFSMITKDKEKKKKRRIKKRNNKKLAANNNNINNNNTNNPQITDINNTNNNNNIFSSNTNFKINIKDNNKKLINSNYDVGHPDSIVFIDNMKITDYFKITKFIDKINGVITKKFYFFRYIINENKKEEEKEEEGKGNVNNNVDFFMDDSSESEN